MAVACTFNERMGHQQAHMGMFCKAYNRSSQHGSLCACSVILVQMLVPRQAAAAHLCKDLQVECVKLSCLVQAGSPVHRHGTASTRHGAINLGGNNQPHLANKRMGRSHLNCP